MEMNAQATKLQVAENDLKQLMADVPGQYRRLSKPSRGYPPRPRRLQQRQNPVRVRARPQLPFKADAIAVADNEHPDHQLKIDRAPEIRRLLRVFDSQQLFGKTVQFVVTAGPVIDRIINLPPPFD